MPAEPFGHDGPSTLRASSGTLLDQGELSLLLESMHGAKVAVAGDFCLDSYWHLDEGPEEASIETGLPVRRVVSQRYSPGGAGNVVANLVALGVGEVRAIGVYGGDPFGPVLVKLLGDLGRTPPGCSSSGRTGKRSSMPSLPGTRRAEPLGFRHPGRSGQEPLRAFEPGPGSAAAWADVVVINQQVNSCLPAPT